MEKLLELVKIIGNRLDELHKKETIENEIRMKELGKILDIINKMID